ncbi:hypothetical protein C789_966 [Microcystis aeruginosa FACHB-905 = DIANCHI905]|nr:hypothetical protein C789_966 [Microcystis aeruginosa FACHB-905 = DIANCHI905]
MYSSLYSLEKLIEWKLFCIEPQRVKGYGYPLYSLEKLIEWKL